MEHLDADDNNDLTAQMNAAVDGVDATPDLDAVITGAARRRRHGRSLSLAGAAAVVALGIGGVFMVSDRDTDELPAAQPVPVIVPLTTLAPGAETPDTEPPVTESLDDVVPVSTIRLDGRQQLDPNAPDPADVYLDQTKEIYRREMPNGYDLQIRTSQVAYGELFGIDWDLPTGSQADCLGSPAVFTGDPTAPREWLSSWTVEQFWPLGDDQEFVVREHYSGDESNVIIRTDLSVTSVAILQNDEIGDAAEFVDGIAAVQLPPYDDGVWEDETGPFLVIDFENAEPRTMALYGDQYGDRGIPDGCQGPPFPGSELPEPGPVQPSDPVRAELSIRDRHAILVDQSIDEKPAGLLTDDTGVAEARAQMEAGQYGESAAGAEYTIDDVVFTDADTAWFQYGIVAPTGTFGPRFGQAIFNGEVWQITRQTICQDLSLAGGRCDDDGTPDLQPPIAGGLDEEAAFNAWYQVSEQYRLKLDCTPINGCGEFDLSRQLPEPGEQPTDAETARAEVIGLMESLYGDGALLSQLDRIDDSTGIADALDRLAAGALVDEVESASVSVVELVFATPTTAAFRYSLTTDGYTFDDRIGFAVEIDGVWKIARDTVCNDLSLGGASCDG